MTQQRKPLKVQEIKFIEAKVQGKSNTEAAMIATGAKTKDVAKTQGHRMSTKVNVQEALEEAFERHGITIDRAVKPIADGLAAYKPGYTDKQGEYHDGTDDHSVRLKAASMAFGLMGLGKGEGSTVNNILVVVTDKKSKYGF